jgi:hypothetical protein
MIAIGEEVIVTKPTIFGPKPDMLAKKVLKSLIYRKMAHTAEDLTSMVLEDDYNFKAPPIHGDIKHGFLLEFDECPDVPIADLEKKVMKLIDERLQVTHVDEEHISLGETKIYHCTGPRIHVRNTGDIRNFRLEKEYIQDAKGGVYVLAGRVDEPDNAEF